MKKIIFLILLFSLTTICIAVESNNKSNNEKIPHKITLIRPDGGVYEKMQGSKNWVEINPSINKNIFIEQNKVESHKKIILNKPTGETVYTYNLKDWYNVSDDEKVESSINIQSLTGYSFAPNPVKTTASLHFILNEKNTVVISVYSQRGIKLSELFNADVSKGEFNLEINGNKYYSGVYILQIVVGDKIYSDKLIIP